MVTVRLDVSSANYTRYKYKMTRGKRRGRWTSSTFPGQLTISITKVEICSVHLYTHLLKIAYILK